LRPNPPTPFLVNVECENRTFLCSQSHSIGCNKKKRDNNIGHWFSFCKFVKVNHEKMVSNDKPKSMANKIILVQSLNKGSFAK